MAMLEKVSHLYICVHVCVVASMWTCKSNSCTYYFISFSHKAYNCGKVVKNVPNRCCWQFLCQYTCWVDSGACVHSWFAILSDTPKWIMFLVNVRKQIVCVQTIVYAEYMI